MGAFERTYPNFNKKKKPAKTGCDKNDPRSFHVCGTDTRQRDKSKIYWNTPNCNSRQGTRSSTQVNLSGLIYLDLGFNAEGDFISTFLRPILVNCKDTWIATVWHLHLEKSCLDICRVGKGPTYKNIVFAKGARWGYSRFDGTLLPWLISWQWLQAFKYYFTLCKGQVVHLLNVRIFPVNSFLVLLNRGSKHLARTAGIWEDKHRNMIID